MKSRSKVLLPLVILALGAAGVYLMILLRPEPGVKPEEDTSPLVRALRVEPRDVQFIVRGQGTIMPRTQSDLVPQVSGEVLWISPNLAAGGFFDAGEPLVRIDRADYEAQLESARANVARAKSEHKRAEKDLARQRRLADRSVASQSRIDDAENAYSVAAASLREKKAQLEQAARDLGRTELRAPYSGRVRQENVDVGHFASRGQPLAKLYAVDYAEVRLPLPDRELAYLDLALAYRTEPEQGEVGSSPVRADRPQEGGPSVKLVAEFAGRLHTWAGQIVRTEGEIDAKSRMVGVVARVEDPYGRDVAAGDRPPLAVGLFVQAEIEGRVVLGAYVVPISALRQAPEGGADRVLIIDDDSRLQFRTVEVLRREREQAVLGEGLFPGERICISPLRAVTGGMRVRVVPEPTEPAPALAGVTQ
jgi:RND family efflux transporter MFP subunit